MGCSALRAKFGDDVFGTGETSLAQATLDLMLQKRKLLVAVDETTGRLVGSLLQPLSHSEAVFDFGYRELCGPPAGAPDQGAAPAAEEISRAMWSRAAAGRAVSAMQVTGADFAAAYMPATVGQCPFVLICDRHGAVACALPPELSDAAIGNQILDLLRRRMQGLRSDRFLHHLPPRGGNIRCCWCPRQGGSGATRCGFRCAAAPRPPRTPTTRRILSR